MSGMRIQAHMFGGWDYDKGLLADADWKKNRHLGEIPRSR